MNSIGIIGYGRLGSLLYEIFKKNLPGADIKIFSPNRKPDNNVFYSLETVCATSNIVIPSVPLSKFDAVLKKISGLLKKDTVIMDVSSVKAYPVKIMLNLLPESVNIIATHPLFGPASYYRFNNKRKALKIVMSNVRCKTDIYNSINNYFKKIGLSVITMSAEDHDKLIAKSQFITQTFYWLSKDLGFNPTAIDTPSARALFEAFEMISSSRELYTELLEFNPYAKQELIKIKNQLSIFGL